MSAFDMEYINMSLIFNPELFFNVAMLWQVWVWLGIPSNTQPTVVLFDAIFLW